jgi:hypothetical protein
MSDKNVIIKQLNGEGTYDNLYPKTKAGLVEETTTKKFVTQEQINVIENLKNFDPDTAGKIDVIKKSDGTTLTVTNKTVTLPNYAELNSSGLIPQSMLPSYVDDVLEYTAKSAFPSTGETGKIYVDLATNKTYRWGGTAYVEISASLAIGTTSGTAYDGASGKANRDDIDDILDGTKTVKKAESATTAGSASTATTATSADKFSSQKTLTVSGDATGSVSTDFSTNPTLSLTLKNSGVTAGTYSVVAVNAKGIVTAGNQLIEVGSAASNSLAVGGLLFEVQS